MPGDPRRRQKKLERRSARRKEKKHLVGRQQNVGLADQMRAAAHVPVLHSSIGESLSDQGIGWVIFSREQPDGRVVVATFLVDRYCLGVKNVVVEVLGRLAYDDKYVRKMRTDLPMRHVSPADARKLLEQAVAYAEGLGLHPHADYEKAMLLFGAVRSAESTAEYEFGKDGQPFYIAGPNDTPERSRQVLAILSNTVGPGRFHYLIPLAGSEFVDSLPEGLRGEARLIGPDEGEEDGDDAI